MFESVFNKDADLPPRCVIIAVFRLLLSIFIPKKQVLFLSLYSYHLFESVEKSLTCFFFFPMFLQAVRAFSRLEALHNTISSHAVVF